MKPSRSRPAIKSNQIVVYRLDFTSNCLPQSKEIKQSAEKEWALSLYKLNVNVCLQNFC